MFVSHSVAEQAKGEMRVLPSARSPEVSIILNLHDETRFLRRTMMSIGEAVSYAAPYGISCEIVCVLDRPDPSTRAWIDRRADRRGGGPG